MYSLDDYTEYRFQTRPSIGSLSVALISFAWSLIKGPSNQVEFQPPFYYSIADKRLVLIVNLDEM